MPKRERKPFVVRGIAANNPNGWLVVVCKGSPKIQGNIRVTVREDGRCRHLHTKGYGKVTWCCDCGAVCDVFSARLRWRKPRRG
jgi:hypothetical protein